MSGGIHVQIGDAIQRGDLDDVQRWLRAHPGAIADYRFTEVPGDTPLYMAWVLRSADIIRLLLDHGVDLCAQDEPGDTTLHLACEESQTESDRELVRLMAKVGNINVSNREGYTPLLIAIKKGDKELASNLLELGADPNVCTTAGFSSFLLAVGNDKEKMWELLKSEGAKPDLFALGAVGDIDEIAQVIQRKPELVTSRLADGTTALHIACRYDQQDAVRLLLANGADPNAADDWKRTPLFFSNADIISMLLDLGADMDVIDEENETPLFEAQTPCIAIALLRGA